MRWVVAFVVCACGRINFDELPDSALTARCEPSPDLAACYDFDGDLVDGSGNNNVVPSPVSYGFAPGMVGMAVSTDATTDLTLAPQPVLELQQYTLELWLQPALLPDMGERAEVFDHDNHYAIGLAPNNIVRCLSADGFVVNSTGPVTAIGSWLHIACTGDGTTLRMYLAGREEASGPTDPMTTAVGAMRIGGNAPTGNPYTGLIDQLRIWTRPLSEAELCVHAGTCL